MYKVISFIYFLSVFGFFGFFLEMEILKIDY